MFLMRRLAILAVIAVAFGVVGCDKGYSPDAGVIVKGKIVKGGNPLVVTGREVGIGKVEVKLVPVDAGLESSSDNAKEDGTFSIVFAGKGVKPGKYKLAVAQIDKMVDVLNGAFNDQATTINVDVPSNLIGKTLDLGTIDLDSPPAAAGGAAAK